MGMATVTLGGTDPCIRHIQGRMERGCMSDRQADSTHQDTMIVERSVNRDENDDE
jgi:hypothetical protein